ncbi:hypothetical protein YerA41_081 [Yersinia phage YerA41]|nr:hypothetical protein YerA41_081 [Yersinia phage YerA41]
MVVDKIIPTPISIKLVHADDWRQMVSAAWLYSRPFLKEDEVDFNQILKIDTPVSEIPGVVVEMYVPILFREILCNSRDHVAWAQTSRNTDLISNWHVLNNLGLTDTTIVSNLFSKMVEESKNSTQDDYRKDLPLSYMTGMTMRLSLRTLFKLIKYFQHLKNTYPSVEMASHQMVEELTKIVESLGIDLSVLKNIKMQDFVPEMKHNPIEMSSVYSSNHTIIKVEIPISLRAQLIRHRVISVVDNLLDIIKSDRVWSLPISTIMQVEISASNSIWKSLVGKRIGWIAQSDLWSPITEAIIRGGNVEDFMMDLSEGYPYAGDNWERIKGTDPGVPDPIHVLELSDDEFKQWITEDMINRMYQYVIDTNRPSKYWNGIIDQVKDRFISIK